MAFVLSPLPDMTGWRPELKRRFIKQQIAFLDRVSARQAVTLRGWLTAFALVGLILAGCWLWS